MLVQNMHQETLAGLRRVWDHISYPGGNVHKIDVTKDMISYARSSNFRYKEALKRKEEEKIEENKLTAIEKKDNAKKRRRSKN